MSDEPVLTDERQSHTALTDEQFANYGVMSDVDLRELGKRLNVKINKITYAEDINPNGTLPYGVNIINLGDEQIGGTHWTLWYVPKDRSGLTYYFDSFGGTPEDNIVNLSERKGKSIVMNNMQIQGYNEQHCGVWTLLMAKILVEANKGDRPQVFEQFVKDNALRNN